MHRKTIQLVLDWDGSGETASIPVGGSEPGSAARTQPTSAQRQPLMEAIVDNGNMRRALKRVRANKGSPGVDGMTVDELAPYLKQAWPGVKASLLSGDYIPRPIRRVEIPKPDGGVRQLGIPTVLDRLIQQAILQFLDQIYDPTFSPSSYGFRPGKSAHQALEAARQHVASGHNWVVDMDLEKFFDRVNHDLLMGRLAKRITDERLLALIRRYLEAGLLLDGVVVTRHEGTPQGGPLSPLLANILLDDLDKILERRGLRFCRYADDCNIYVKSRRAGERVMASLVAFLERKLHLKVNTAKSAVARPWERKFLGQRVLGGREQTYLGVHPKSVKRLEDKVRQITRRNRGVTFDLVLAQLRSATMGWVNYHRHARCTKLLKRLDEWIRRRLRCYLWKQWKRPKARARNLLRLGIGRWLAYGAAYNGHGAWVIAGCPAMTQAATNQRLKEKGFESLYERYQALASA
jgi:RNA-directed DNA polymerase